MRRRRIRIRRHEEEQQQAQRLRDQATRHTATNQAATVQTAEPDHAPIVGLNPAQMWMLDLQQQSGNQTAMRVMRSMIQRDSMADDPMAALLGEGKKDKRDEKKDDKDKEKQSADNQLSEAVTTGGLSGVDSDDPDAMFQAGLSAYKDKKYGKALVIFRELFMQKPHSNTLINMAVCELRLDLFPEAQDDFSRALDDENVSSIDRKRGESALQITRVLESVGSVGFIPLPRNVNTDNAPVAKEPRALRNQINLLYHSAEGAAKSEDYEAALNAFKIAQRRLPNPITLLNMGKCLVMLRRYDEAQTMFDRALRDRELQGGPRKMTEAEKEAAKRFKEQLFDQLGGSLPPDDPIA